MINTQKTFVIILSLVALIALVGCAEKTSEVIVDMDAAPDTVVITDTNTPTDTSTDVQTNEPAASNTTIPVTEDKTTISLAELATHNSESDCWVAYDGEVYDVTGFLPRHPGGVNAIARFCGTADAFQEAFTKQHGTGKVSNLKRQLYKGELG